MASRKRGRAEMEAEEPPKAAGLLSQLRNLWEFANVMQFIYIFGKAFKIDEDFDIEDLEDECLKPEPSYKLAEIALCLLKFISSQRGLTLDILDEHTSRQYKRRIPDRNPFGNEEEPKKFVEFDVFTKLRVLWQLSQWVFLFPDRLREKMPEAKDAEQTSWRIEEIGYDRKDRHYFVLDDNRLYRRTDPVPAPPPTLKSKAKSKSKGKAKKPRMGERSSKRRKTADYGGSDPEDDEAPDVPEVAEAKDQVYDGFGGFKWECVAITLSDYQDFLDSIKRSKDVDEKDLHVAITDEIMPVIEKLEEDREKKIQRRQRELLNMEKMAHAKRSSRIAGKYEREKEEAEAAAAEKKRQLDLAAARRDADRQKEMEKARQSRMMTREQRIKEREYKRILHEEELATLSEDSKKLATGDARMSERHLKAEMAKKKKQLEELQEVEAWVFDCAKCGVHGANIDDGSHSVACERCNIWQHSHCLGISQAEAEKEDFHFVCKDCVRREEDAKKPKIPSLKFKVAPSSSPPLEESEAQIKRPVGRPRKHSIASPENGTEKRPIGRPRNSSNGVTQNVTEKRQVGRPRKSAASEPEEGPKKRKTSDASDAVRMPPMKKFKPYHSISGTSGAHASPGVHSSPDAMHLAFMNGPTLSPQGQMAPLHGVDGAQTLPPPGLASPSRPAVYLNGYSQHVQYTNHQSGRTPSVNGHSAPPSHNTPSPNDRQEHGAQPGAPTPSTRNQTPTSVHRTPQSKPSVPITPAPVTCSPSGLSPFLTTPSTTLLASSTGASLAQPGYSPQKSAAPAHSSPAHTISNSPSLKGSASPTMAPPTSDFRSGGLSPLKQKQYIPERVGIGGTDLTNGPGCVDDAENGANLVSGPLNGHAGPHIQAQENLQP